MDDKNDLSPSAVDKVEINMPWINRSEPGNDNTNGISLAAEDTIEIDIPRIDRSLPPIDEIHDDPLPPPDYGDNNGVVILLVGNKATDKRGVVDSLTRTGTWDDCRTAVDSSNCVRILTCTSQARVIVDTTPLRNVKGKSPLAIARAWISRNCLRRILCGKNVFVVCVVTCRVRNTCTLDMFTYSNCWVDVFGLIFNYHRAAIMILVNTEGRNDVSKEMKEKVALFVLEHGLPPKNITYSNLEEGDDSVSTLIEENIGHGRIHNDGKPHKTRVNSSRVDSSRLASDLDADGRRPPRWKACWHPNGGGPDTNYNRRTAMPFTINEDLFSKHMFRPWGPERVILFGRTGSGKSTLAQMLTLGMLDKQNKTFVPSSGARGGTKKVQPGIGRGWYVVDTPGFGEPKDGQSTISTRQVENKIKDYVRVLEGTFSHFVYVVKKERLDILEPRLWKFFVRLFGKKMKRQFTVVVSNADDDWVRANMSDLEECFEGCESFLSADFPPVDDEDEEVEKIYQGMRTESLLALEEKLATLNRCDMFCEYGRSAKMTIRMETERANLDLGIERNERIRYLVRGASILFAFCNLSQRPFSELANILRVDSDFTLIPE